MNIIADLHIHTSACPHGHSTREEILSAAKDRGLYAVGISEHIQGFPDGVPLEYLEEEGRWPNSQNGVRLLRGAETDIWDYDGRLWLQRRFMKNLDYLIASAHKTCLSNGDIRTGTHMWMGVAENPDVDIIGHCGRDNDRFPFEYEPVIRAFGEMGKTVEINNASLGKADQVTACRRIAELCGKYEVPIIVGTDAHYASGVGNFDGAISLLSAVGIPDTQVVNSSVERLDAWIASAASGHRK